MANKLQHLMSVSAQLLRLSACLAFIVLLNACATTAMDSGSESVDANENQSGSTADTPAAKPLADKPLADKQIAKSPPPIIDYGQFTEDELTRTIMAELAMQRGLNKEALDTYVALAYETGNLSIIQRAMRLATYLRNTQVSLELGELWLQQEPESMEVRQMMAVQLVLTARYREALNQMIFLLENGEDIDFRLIPSRTASDSSAALILDALIADYLELYQRLPQSRTLRIGLAMLYQQNNQNQQALDVIAALSRDTNDDPEIVMEEIKLLEVLGETALAQRRLQQSLKSYPRHKQLRFMYGRKLITEQRFTEAKDQFTILVEQDPLDFDMLYSLALLSMEVKMFSDARSYLQRLVLNGQKLDDAHFHLGYINAEESKIDAAIEQYLLVKAGNNFLQAQRNLTDLMVKTDRYAEVHTHLQNIRFRNVDYNIPLLSMEANVLIEQKKYDDASLLLNNSVGAFPNNIQLLFQRSVLSQELNNLPLMEQDLRRIIMLDPTNPVAYNSLGYTLADRTERYQEAYELIQSAIELSPDDPAIIDSLGWVQYRLGLYTEAKKNLERAYELFPDPEVAAHLGEVLWVLGDKNSATRLWRAALQVQPDSPFILNAMERLNPGSSL